MGFFDFLTNRFNDKEVSKIMTTVKLVEGYDEACVKLTDSELKAKTVEFKERVQKGETLDDLLPEAFAVVREAAVRTLGMKHDYKINMMDYDDPFYTAIENLIKLHFSQEQQNIINWWLYDKFLPTGEMLVLTNKDTEEIIPSDTPEDIWDLVQEHEKKNTK